MKQKKIFVLRFSDGTTHVSPSIAAIYRNFTKEEVGASASILYHHDFTNLLHTKKCVISKKEVLQ